MKIFKLKKILHWFSIILVSTLLSGCNSSLMNPQGTISEDQKVIILSSIGLMCIIVVPVIFMAIFFSIKYWEKNNKKSVYLPDWSFSKKIEFFCWFLPMIVVLILSILAWKTTHRLDPYKKINSSEKKIIIQAISADWKWFFIYPFQKIATINEICIPINVPIEFHLTSYSVMNSFFIPSLGGQIYAMNGMKTRINLISKNIGVTDGFSSSYSGSGFSDMKFKVIMCNKSDYIRWIEKVKNSKNQLKNFEEFKKIAAPSVNNPISYFSNVFPNLYDCLTFKH
ncbi:ubiquinol oxidase subunit II [Candidatus Riesia pediculicola]|uniref:ubiquinol oxidase subunit II n=1 Tax=Candidatus Riesia pediculicola TaxID=401619 RepID=UPI0009C33F9C|nr:ubiquinol oxidase subunit II [Candidatus Riesia pediculicola]ARC54146.1 ubiquinol oxidase subunit II [Candidatus Riesia pediculicola]